VHGRTVHLRAVDYESLYKGCEGEIPHFYIVFLSLLLLCSLLSLISFSSPMEKGGGRWWRSGGRPSWTAAPPLLTPKPLFLYFFFAVSLLLPFLILNPVSKLPKQVNIALDLTVKIYYLLFSGLAVLLIHGWSLFGSDLTNVGTSRLRSDGCWMPGFVLVSDESVLRVDDDYGELGVLGFLMNLGC